MLRLFDSACITVRGSKCDKQECAIFFFASSLKRNQMCDFKKKCFKLCFKLENEQQQTIATEMKIQSSNPKLMESIALNNS